jgi:hypothetical protein
MNSLARSASVSKVAELPESPALLAAEVLAAGVLAAGVVVVVVLELELPQLTRDRLMERARPRAAILFRFMSFLLLFK